MREIFGRWSATGGPETLEGTEGKSFFTLLQMNTENFTPLLQSALSVVRNNFFLLSHQYEFNRLSLTYVVLSKRKLRKLVEEGVLPRTPVKHFVAGISAGIIDDAPMLDLPYSEDSRAMVDLNCVMN